MLPSASGCCEEVHRDCFTAMPSTDTLSDEYTNYKIYSILEKYDTHKICIFGLP